MGLLGLFYNLYHVGFLVSQRHLVAHNLVFHGVLQRCVKQHLNALSLNEAHLNDALTEAAMAVHLHDDALLTCFQF